MRYAYKSGDFVEIVGARYIEVIDWHIPEDKLGQVAGMTRRQIMNAYFEDGGLPRMEILNDTVRNRSADS